MPYSDFFNRKVVIDYIKSKVDDKKSIKILDLGIGLGFFGELIKKKIKDNVVIDGVEVWKKYKNVLWKKYDQIYLQDIENFLLKNKKKYDIILLIDVIEHFDKKKGEKIIKMIKKQGKSIVISTPITYYPQNSTFGNPYEKHKSFWSKKDLENKRFKLINSKRILQNIFKIFLFKNCPLSAELGIFSYEN